MPPRLSQKMSLEELVRCHLDISSVPRRSFFEKLAHFADDELEKEKLHEFCSSEGQVWTTMIG